MKTRQRLIAAALCCAAGLGAPSMAYAIDEVPDNLVNLTLDPELLADVQEALPESRNVDSSFLNPGYDPNVRLSEDSQLAITFIDEGAGYRNSLGWFSFEDNAFDGLSHGAIDLNGSGNISLSELDALSGVSTGLVFPNASRLGGGGQLLAGDTAVIGGGTASLADDGSLFMEGGTIFEAGSNIGFFVAANAWNGRGVQGVDQWGDPNVYYSVDFLNPEASADSVFGDTSDYSRHVAMMFADTGKDEIIMGFEDLNRLGNSDEDFNDAVFLVRSSPEQAISGSQIAVHSAPAPSLGGGLGTIAMGSLLSVGFIRRRTSTQKEA
ncbi:MAG: DUF4114 domain-containing protein [Magnetovibrionaceae bacterium]